jgi:DNA-binding FadR family transcriptional regulator
MSIEPIQQIGMHERIQERIMAYILKNRLRPGDRLPTEDTLSTRLGASRTVIREALRSLQALGMIESRQGSGRYVRSFDLEALASGLAYSLAFDAASIRELLAVRRVLEAAFLPDALGALTPAVLEDLGRLVGTMRERATRGQLISAEDRAFHLTLFTGVANRVLSTLLEAFWGLFESALDEPLRRSADLLRTVRLHEEIVRALGVGDLDAAREALDHHFDDVEKRLSGHAVSHPLGRPG